MMGLLTMQHALSEHVVIQNALSTHFRHGITRTKRMPNPQLPSEEDIMSAAATQN